MGNVFLEQYLEESNSYIICFVLNQQKKREKCFEHTQNYNEFEKKHGPNAEMMKLHNVQTHHPPYHPHPPQCVCPHNMKTQLISKKDIFYLFIFFRFKSTCCFYLFFFFVCVSICVVFFWGGGDWSMNGLIGGLRESTTHYVTSRTDGGLQAAWRQGVPRVAMGTGVHGELSERRRLCLCPSLKALGSICQHGQKWRLEERRLVLSASLNVSVKVLLLSPLHTKQRKGHLDN